MDTGSKHISVFAAIAYLLAGPIIWAGHLLLVYGPQSALCAFGKTGFAQVGDAFVSTFVLAITLVSAGPLIFALIWPRIMARLLRYRVEGSDRSLSFFLMRWLTALSLIGVLWAGATAFMLDPCAQLR
jgi:hypothetical protein